MNSFGRFLYLLDSFTTMSTIALIENLPALFQFSGVLVTLNCIPLESSKDFISTFSDVHWSGFPRSVLLTYSVFFRSPCHRMALALKALLAGQNRFVHNFHPVLSDVGPVAGNVFSCADRCRFGDKTTTRCPPSLPYSLDRLLTLEIPQPNIFWNIFLAYHSPPRIHLSFLSVSNTYTGSPKINQRLFYCYA